MIKVAALQKPLYRRAQVSTTTSAVGVDVRLAVEDAVDAKLLLLETNVLETMIGFAAVVDVDWVPATLATPCTPVGVATVSTPP